MKTLNGSGDYLTVWSFSGLQPTNGYRCKINTCDAEDFKFGDFPEDIFPKDKESGDPDYCRFYRPKLTDQTAHGNCSHESFTDVVSNCGSDAEFVYNEFEFEETLVTKWNLVCGQSFKVALVISMYMLGVMISSFLTGRMADKFGRKKTLMFSILCSSLASLLGAFMPEYYSYTFTR